ncbi:hypothetical protein K7432_012016 [Basidiobolus ranarum]|uniref:Uncharacterized protein n=1 Tax=Basidiobolus ranarum TaxID=34480 RepID=A0ABR2WLH6_9FUNG
MTSWLIHNILTSTPVIPKRINIAENGGYIMEHTKSLHFPLADVGHAKEISVATRPSRHRRGTSRSKSNKDSNAGLAIAMCGSGFTSGAAGYFIFDRAEN